MSSGAGRWPWGPHAADGAVEGGGQAGQGERPDQQPEVAEGDVVEVGLQQQVDDDAGEPGGDQVATESWPDGDHESGDDLDDADGEHGLVGVAGNEVVDLGREVLLPVDEPVEELVETEQDRCDGEADAQQGERLEHRVVEPRCGAATLPGRWGWVTAMATPLLKVTKFDVRSRICCVNGVLF